MDMIKCHWLRSCPHYASSITSTRAPAPLSQADATLLHKIIIQFSNFDSSRNSFDCVTTCAVRWMRWALGIVAMLDAVTALFGVISVGIFIAHAVDGYWSR